MKLDELERIADNADKGQTQYTAFLEACNPDTINLLISWIRTRQEDLREVKEKLTDVRHDNVELRRKLSETQRLMAKLLNKVNRVTSHHRHKGQVPVEDLDVLANVQVDIEGMLDE